MLCESHKQNTGSQKMQKIYGKFFTNKQILIAVVVLMMILKLLVMATEIANASQIIMLKLTRKETYKNLG